MVSDRLTLAEIDDLCQVDQGMAYPENPPEAMGMPYRVSTYVKDAKGAPIKGSLIHLSDLATKTPIASKVTDSFGRVYFDLPNANPVLFTPDAPGASPPTAQWTPTPITVGFFAWMNPKGVPGSRAWNWADDSINFVYGGEGTGMPDGSSLNVSQILMYVGVDAIGYFVYQKFFKSPGA